MAQVSPLLVAIVIILVFVMIILIVLVVLNRQKTTTSTSTLANSICTEPPSFPVNVVVSNPQGDLLVVTWSPIAGADSYIAYIGTTAGFSVSSAVNSTSTKYSSTSFANLALGATYYIKVKAVNTCGISDFSPEVSFTITYKFPSRFVIANQTNANALLCDTHDNIYDFAKSDQVAASRFCSDLGSRAFYQTSDQTIRQSDRPGYCMTRDSGNTIYYHPCTGAANQKWGYNSLDNTMCSGTNPGFDCINLQTYNGYAGTVTWGPKSTALVSAWNINPV